jgi:hypothetical protein
MFFLVAKRASGFAILLLWLTASYKKTKLT